MRTLSVLGLWVAAAMVFSAVTTLILRRLAVFVTRKRPDDQERAVDLATLLPSIVCGYLFFCLLVFAAWSELRGFDMSWKDSWNEPLLGKYHLLMVDTMDVGSIYHEVDKADRFFWEPADHYEIESNIRRLQIDPPYLIGAAAPAALTAGGAKSAPESLFFIINSRTGTDSHYKTFAQLQEGAQNLALSVRLQPVEQLYRENRYSLADLNPAVLLLIPPAFMLYFLFSPRPQKKRKRSRSRRRSRPASSSRVRSHAEPLGSGRGARRNNY